MWAKGHSLFTLCAGHFCRIYRFDSTDTMIPARLSYGIDSAGNTCGQKNNWNGTNGPDLTSYKKLYHLDPLELLDSNSFLGARSICVQSCPGTESVCSLSSLPCRNTTEYRYTSLCLSFRQSTPYMSLSCHNTLRALLSMGAARIFCLQNVHKIVPYCFKLDIGYYIMLSMCILSCA